VYSQQVQMVFQIKTSRLNRHRYWHGTILWITGEALPLVCKCFCQTILM